MSFYNRLFATRMEKNRSSKSPLVLKFWVSFSTTTTLPTLESEPLPQLFGQNTVGLDCTKMLKTM